jgi:hypothetical protein
VRHAAVALCGGHGVGHGGSVLRNYFLFAFYSPFLIY